MQLFPSLLSLVAPSGHIVPDHVIAVRDRSRSRPVTKGKPVLRSALLHAIADTGIRVYELRIGRWIRPVAIGIAVGSVWACRIRKNESVQGGA